MKPGFFPLHNYYFKYAGYILFMVGITFIITSLFTNRITKDQGMTLTAFGLFIIAFSKEKEETEWVQLSRNHAFRITTGLFLVFFIVRGVLINFSYDAAKTNELMINMVTLTNIYLLCYLFIFLVLLYLFKTGKINHGSIHSDGSVSEKTGNHLIKFYLLGLLIIACISALILVI